MSEDLVINHEPPAAPSATGSILITPRLRRRPTYVRAASPTVGRFSGWWGNTTSLRSRNR